MAIGLVAFFSKGEDGFGIKKNFGIDFNEGTIQQLMFEDPVGVDQIRQSLRDIGLGDSLIQQFGDNNKEVIIRTYSKVDREITEKLKTDFIDNRFEVLRVERVGPSVGRELTKKTFIALALALGAICLYISWRFEFRFAVAAIVALVHDCLITIGAFSLAGREISLPVVAALLTIIGYSLNDTIVVFDRIREDLKLMKKKSYEEIINISINQTLSRTLLTSLTTLLVVGTIYFFGGEVINDFAYALLIGVMVGTYSSIFVASPILVEWHHRAGRG
ncbi:MAG: protein translocase subunit SecF [Candidatus Omnitrophica bacterium]|nr:protein translocase subunit SecF [Candidatus Omnitrophota bacterium]